MANPRWNSIVKRLHEKKSNRALGERICEVAVEVFDADFASIALSINGNYSPFAASSDVAILLDETQYSLGQGPTFDSVNARLPIVIDKTNSRESSHRWPVFIPVLTSHGMRSMYVFPLRIGNAYIGSLSVYKSDADEMSPEQLSDGLILASLAGTELVEKTAGVADRDDALTEPGLYDRSSLQIAAGMVAEALNCSIISALVQIRARAFSDDVPVSRLAQQIIAREVVLEIDNTKDDTK